MSELSREERHAMHFPSAVRDALPAKNCWVCADKERIAALEKALRLALEGPSEKDLDKIYAVLDGQQNTASEAHVSVSPHSSKGFRCTCEKCLT